MVGAPGPRNAVIGVVVLAAALFMEGELRGLASGLPFYVALVVGGVLFIHGLYVMFAGGAPRIDAGQDPEELAREVMLATLARMAYADTNIDKVEVDAICKIYKNVTGDVISAGEVRVAARADLYQAGPFRKYLAAAAKRLDKAHKVQVLKAAVDVVKVDGSVSPGEVEFFNEIGTALMLDPAEIRDLTGELD